MQINETVANHSIGCTVEECKYHCTTDECCSLQHIQVGKCEPCANTCECTECASFEKKM